MKSLLENKKGMLPRNWIIIVVLIGMLFVASSYWISAWQDKYVPLEAANLTQSFNAIDEMSLVTDSLEGKMQSETKATGIEFLDFIVQGGYNVLIAVLAVPNVLREFVVGLGDQFGIPRVFRDGLIILIAVAAIFGIIVAIFRRKV